MKWSRAAAMPGALAVILLSLGACGDILTVTDPNRLTSDDLDSQLALVANGVEGSFHDQIDVWVFYQALLADVYQSTDTSRSYREIDHGELSGHELGSVGAAWIRTLATAADAEARFDRVLGQANAVRSPLTAQVRLTRGLAELYIGATFCEWQLASSDAMLTDLEILSHAERSLTEAIATAQLASRPEYATTAQAARAQARLLLGQWSGAESDAAAIPDDFSYEAVFAADTNRVARLSNWRYQRVAGLMYKWWPLVETTGEPGFLTDPWSGVPDPRLPVLFTGALGDDFETPYYGQEKYSALDDDIPLLHSDLMRLVEAEVRWRSGDFAGATAILNELRMAVGLPAHETPTSDAAVREVLLWERFAELFMEGQRLVDLHRFGIMREVFDALDDPARPGLGRPSKWGFGCTDW